MRIASCRYPAILATLVAALVLLPGSAAIAQQSRPVTGDRGSDMAVDLVLVRPLGIVATVVGAAGFVLALPFTLPSGSAGDTAREWIGAPLDYTFKRPLGEFDHCATERQRCGRDDQAPTAEGTPFAERAPAPPSP
ncbi:MAG TPA: hypothetical protein PK725_12780 [Rhodocyclaceae bacterium]|nr:hypothetical protein [Rhodocyclaceae bacterium]HRQ47820.1 hypothetical protein [Rhodocyclaceae bacterium]